MFRYILVHRNHAGLSIGVSEMQLKHLLRRKKHCDGLAKSIDFAWGNDLYDKRYITILIQIQYLL
jgi:hypothetical protein